MDGAVADIQTLNVLIIASVYRSSLKLVYSILEILNVIILNSCFFKFELIVFQKTGNHSQEDKEELSTAACAMQDAIISTSHKCTQLNDRIKSFDLLGAVNVLISRDVIGTTPANWLDFSERKNTMMYHNSLPYETVLQWDRHCLCWGMNASSIASLTYK